MNRRKRSTKPRTLEIKKETVIVLTDEMLGNVDGGRKQGNSIQLSVCDKVCATH
jgi:hypothetical protein